MLVGVADRRAHPKILVLIDESLRLVVGLRSDPAVLRRGMLLTDEESAIASRPSPLPNPGAQYRNGQRVEKVGIEQVAATDRARNGPKSAYLVPDLGLERAQGEFFNRLGNSANFTMTSLCEVRNFTIVRGSPVDFHRASGQ